MASCQRKDVFPSHAWHVCWLTAHRKGRTYWDSAVSFADAWKALPSSTEKMRGDWYTAVESCIGVVGNSKQLRVDTPH